MVSLLAMLTARMSANAQEVEIDLFPGWTYIAYPYPTTVNLDTFFSSVTPMNGDRIAAQFGYSTYMNGRWRGSVTILYPGEGYHYFSNNTEIVTLVLDNPIVPEETITITTGEPTDITAESATISGEVMLLTDTHVFMRGVCWGTTSDPDIDGSYFLDGEGEGSFTVTLDELTPNTTYYVRVYAVSDHGLAYGEELSFTTVALPSYTVSVTANPAEGGTVSGAGSYEQGQSCTITATANEGYTFTNWTENDEVVFTEATYTFTVTGDRTLVANFTQNGGDVPVGAIDGLFSVSEDQQVYFSQGNLQYQASTNTWKFADNQWDMIGSENSNISENYSGWIDLFGWGTSGYHDANDPYNVNYQPWSTSSSWVNSYNNFGYGPSTNMTDPNLTGTSANYDWGVYNPISNGGNQAGQWRSLTQSEWYYVLNTRVTTSGIRYAKANVNNINGVILLPDDWSSTIFNLSNTDNKGASFSSNTITASQWTTLESAGAVFLPAAGYRDGTSVGNVGSDGGYWCASRIGSDSAYDGGFYDSGLYMGSSYRCHGRSVRLVRVAEN